LTIQSKSAFGLEKDHEELNVGVPLPAQACPPNGSKLYLLEDRYGGQSDDPRQMLHRTASE
jgi:hypothetical protein